MRSSSIIDAPPVLVPERYDTVRQLMTKSRAFGHKTGVIALTGSLIDDQYEYRRRRRKEPRHIDRSLVGQLRDLLRVPDKATNGLAQTPPEAYLFTARSAVPVADAFRGFFEESGIEQPLLTHIGANKTMSALLDKPADRISSVTALLVERHEAEIERLTSTVGGMEHVCVVEEFVGGGRTLRYAGSLLTNAGVNAVSAIRGAWYQQAFPEDISVEDLTSAHKEFMYGVGALASAA